MAAAGILAYLIVATFPAEFRPTIPGLDPSWVYAINALPLTDTVFGRDVVFSFGPLGYLFHPLDIGSNVVEAAALWVVSQLVIVAMGVAHYRRSGRIEPLLAFSLIALVATTVGELAEYRILILLGLTLSEAPVHRRIWRVATAFGAVFAGILTFTRLSTGLAVAAMLAIVTLTWLARRDIGLREALVVVVLPFAATTAIMTVLVFGSPGTMLSWVAASLEYTSGYPEAMSYPGPAVLILLFAAGVAVYAITAFVLARRVPAVAPVALALGALMLLGLRHGVVRHHARFLPAMVLGSIAVLVLAAGTRRGAIQGILAAAVVLGLSLAAATVPECFCPWRPESLAPTRGWNGAVSLVTLNETRERVAAESAARLADSRLPDSFVAAARDGTVDAIPWELSFMPANDLRWEPNPVLQTYSAYTSDLDRWTADHFASADAPRSLLVQFVEIDARHPMLVAPAMWRTILEGYEPSALPPAEGSWGQVALLQRRPREVLVDQRPLGTTEGRIGRWVEVPSSDGLVFGSIRLRHDLGGRLARLLWRIDPVFLDLRLAEGGAVTVRFVPSTARNGLLLNRLPMTLGELLGLYDGHSPRELTGFRIHGPGAVSFERDFEVVWSGGGWEPLLGSSEAAR